MNGGRDLPQALSCSCPYYLPVLISFGLYTKKSNKKRKIWKIIELQLLVIDLGDSCVVKVEKGGPNFDKIFQDIIVTGYQDTTAFISVPFSGFKSVKESIDALEEKPPVPRIELCAATGEMTLYDRDVISDLRILDYHALSQLAGKPLPIWTPTKGGWKKLVEIGEYNPLTGNSAPVEIWRYIRRK